MGAGEVGVPQDEPHSPRYSPRHFPAPPGFGPNKPAAEGGRSSYGPYRTK